MCVYTILFMARRMKTYRDRDRDRDRHSDRIFKLTSGVIIRHNKEFLMLRDPETDTQTEKRAEMIDRQADRLSGRLSESRGEKAGEKNTFVWNENKLQSLFPKAPLFLHQPRGKEAGEKKNNDGEKDVGKEGKKSGGKKEEKNPKKRVKKKLKKKQ